MHLHLAANPPKGLMMRGKVVAAQLTASGIRTEIGSSTFLNGYQALLTSAPTVSKQWGRQAGLARKRAVQRDGYILQSADDGIFLKATDVNGFYYGCQTLRQLLDGGREVPGLDIEDAPLLPQRGLPLDMRG